MEAARIELVADGVGEPGLGGGGAVTVEAVGDGERVEDASIARRGRGGECSV